MGLLLTFQIAVRALSRNKMRAALTVLGVVIGIAAVTTVVSIGTGAGRLIQGEIESFGTNFLYVGGRSERRRGKSTMLPKLTIGDFRAIGSECPAVLAVSPMVSVSDKPIVYGNQSVQPSSISGVGADFPLIRSWNVQVGDFFTDRQVKTGQSVCVVGQTIAHKLFQTRNPLTKTIRVGSTPVEVIGVMEEKGGSMGMGGDQDSTVLLPWTTVRGRIIGSKFKDVNAIYVAARSPELTDRAAKQINTVLLKRHRIPKGQEPDFEVHSSREAASMMGTITGILTALLSSIAGISLLVGGVGIMNIMLVSVTERTREIGIRMAVGARGRDILVQFLIESVVLSCFGGALGLAMGVGASTLAAKIIAAINPDLQWPIVVSFTGAFVAMVFAAAVGVIFGLYPAWRASRLDPIDALRYE